MASHVNVPDCIRVTNLKPGTSEDMIELYFENTKRSGGGEVREVELDEDRNQAIVFFEDWKGKYEQTYKHKLLPMLNIYTA